MNRAGSCWMGIALCIVAAACGGSDDGLVDPVPDPAVEPFVGTWDAEVMTVTSVADTTVVADLIGIGGTFIIDIQPSGQYTAQLSFAAADSVGIEPFVELGTMTVTGGFVTLRPNNGPVASSEYQFESSDYLVLDGATDFDFNLDEEPDPGQLHLELQRR